MHRPSADFPIDGRAARITRFPGWKPEVRRSSSLNPAGTPVISTPASYSCVMRSKLSLRSTSMCAKSLVDLLLPELEDDLLGAIDEIRHLVPSRSCPRRTISWPARMSPRSVDISLTMRA